jgi:hypothetical protein
MKLSKDKINEWIQLYLNDLEDYGDSSADFIIAEHTLHSFHKLLVESNQDVSIMLREAIVKSSKEQREVYENFLEYLENV